MVFSQMTASSSASWSLARPPLSFVSGHESTMWPIVCRWPQSQWSDAARPQRCYLARHGPGPWSVWKLFSSVHDWHGQVEARLLDGRVAYYADWPKKPTTSLLPTALLCRCVLLLPKWGDETWLVAQDCFQWNWSINYTTKIWCFYTKTQTINRVSTLQSCSNSLTSPDISTEYLRSIDPFNSSDTKQNACYFLLQY